MRPRHSTRTAFASCGFAGSRTRSSRSPTASSFQTAAASWYRKPASGELWTRSRTLCECGYTPQYEGLEKLYRRYRDRGLVVLGFPANDFGGQEPGSNKQIADFCQVNYGVTFPVFAKSSVVGANANPVFRDLTAKTGAAPRWNFHKYLVDRSGAPVASFTTRVEPLDPKLTREIERLLAL